MSTSTHMLLSPASDRAPSEAEEAPDASNRALSEAEEAPDTRALSEAEEAADNRALSEAEEAPDASNRALSEADEPPDNRALSEAEEAPDNRPLSQADGQEDGQEAEAQGRRAKAAMVTKRKSKSSKRMFVPRVVDGRVTGITIREEGKSDVEVKRPADGDRSDPIFAVWKCYDQQRKKTLDLEAQVNVVSSKIEKIRDLLDQQPEPRPEPRPRRSNEPPGRAMVVDHERTLQQIEALPENLRPVRVGVLGNGRNIEPAMRWQTKPLPDSVRAEIDSKWYIEVAEDTQDRSGRNFVPHGPKNASFCGSFPHAICKPKVGPRRNKSTYLIGGSHDVNLRVTLKRRATIPGEPPTDVSERQVIDLLRDRLPADEVGAWGSFESSLVWYAEIQFDRSVADSNAATIVTNTASANCAFTRSPLNGKLLLPPESVPYSGGYYEQMMSNGLVEFQFKTNHNVTSCNLREQFQARQFRIAIWTLNPYLNSLPAFRAVTLPFSIKSTLHNDLKRSERWVESAGPNSAIVPCTQDRILSVAPSNRRKRKVRASADDDEY